METTRPLPARERPLPGESLASLLRRTANTMGYEHVRLLLLAVAEAGYLPWNVNQLASSPALERLAELLKQPAEELWKLSIHRFAPALVLTPANQVPARVCDSKTIYRWFASSAPLCSSCLRDDGAPYDRIVWSWRPLPVCLRHHITLIDRCPECRRRLRVTRQSMTHCHCGQDFSQIETAGVSEAVVQWAGRMESWLCGEDLPLPNMSSAACFWWAECLVAAIKKTPVWLEHVADELQVNPDRPGHLSAWLAATQILEDWPNRLERFLEEFQQTPRHRATATRIGPALGRLLCQAAHLEKLGFIAPADALRDYLLHRYARRHISRSVSLFQSPSLRHSLDDREWITQKAATQLLRLRHGAVADLVCRGILTGQDQIVSHDSHLAPLVCRDSVMQLKVDLSRSVDTLEVGRRLGIGRNKVLELLHANLLPRSVRTGQGWRFLPESIEDLRSFYDQLPFATRPDHQWLTVRRALRTFGPSGLSFALLIRSINNREVAAQRLATVTNLKELVVAKVDLNRIMPEITRRHVGASGLPLDRLAAVLFPGQSVQSAVLMKWIRLGLIRVEQAGRARVVSVDELERFRSMYCLSAEACQILSISGPTLRCWEAAGRVQPVYGRRSAPSAGFSLYGRADLQRLAAARSAKCDDSSA